MCSSEEKFLLQSGFTSVESFCMLFLHSQKTSVEFAKEPLTIGLFCGKWPMKIRQPMTPRHPVITSSVEFTYLCGVILHVVSAFSKDFCGIFSTRAPFDRYSPFPRRWGSKWSSEFKIESWIVKVHVSFSNKPSEKRPVMTIHDSVVNSDHSGFRFEFWWLYCENFLNM